MQQILTVGSFEMFSRNVANYRSIPDHFLHVKHPRTQHSSTSCWYYH